MTLTAQTSSPARRSALSTILLAGLGGGAVGRLCARRRARTAALPAAGGVRPRVRRRALPRHVPGRDAAPVGGGPAVEWPAVRGRHRETHRRGPGHHRRAVALGGARRPGPLTARQLNDVRDLRRSKTLTRDVDRAGRGTSWVWRIR